MHFHDRNSYPKDLKKGQDAQVEEVAVFGSENASTTTINVGVFYRQKMIEINKTFCCPQYVVSLGQKY